MRNVRILVVGDHGIGKTASCALLCLQGEAASSPNLQDIEKTAITVGCDVHVAIYRIGGRELGVEFVDLGGHEAYTGARDAFMFDIDGVILAFEKGLHSSGELRKQIERWLSVPITTSSTLSEGRARSSSLAPVRTIADCPVLFMETKSDIRGSSVSSSSALEDLSKALKSSKESSVSARIITTSARTKSIEPLKTFFDFVLECSSSVEEL